MTENDIVDLPEVDTEVASGLLDHPDDLTEAEADGGDTFYQSIDDLDDLDNGMAAFPFVDFLPNDYEVIL